jgi:hypothetical protein
MLVSVLISVMVGVLVGVTSGALMPTCVVVAEVTGSMSEPLYWWVGFLPGDMRVISKRVPGTTHWPGPVCCCLVRTAGWYAGAGLTDTNHTAESTTQAKHM